MISWKLPFDHSLLGLQTIRRVAWENKPHFKHPTVIWYLQMFLAAPESCPFWFLKLAAVCNSALLSLKSSESLFFFLLLDHTLTKIPFPLMLHTTQSEEKCLRRKKRASALWQSHMSKNQESKKRRTHENYHTTWSPTQLGSMLHCNSKYKVHNDVLFPCILARISKIAS